MNKQITNSGANQTLALLQQYGVMDIFGYPGGAIMPMYDALYSSDIKHYLCRHEQGAAMAAIGYARASQRVGVCMATSGPGATNLITGLADAMADSIPVIAITGQVSTKAMGSDAFQEVDIMSLSLACTKHSFQVKKLEDLAECIHQAFEIATSDRPGPVLIDIPKDIQVAVSNQPLELVYSKRHLSANNRSQPIDEKISQTNRYQKAVELIAQAERPVLYIGGGVGMAAAESQLEQLIGRLKYPSVATLKGLGCIAYDQKNYLGMLGMHGTKAANMAIQQSDLLLVVGARFDDRATGKLDQFAPEAKVIHMDIDPAEINKRRFADVALLGDLKHTIKILIDAIDQKYKQLSFNDISNWTNSCVNKLESLKRENDEHKDNLNVPIDATQLLLQVNHFLTPNSSNSEFDSTENKKEVRHSYVTTDVGQHQMWAAQYLQFSFSNQFISSCGLGTMGFGIPAAIGVQISRPESLVVSVTGDGSLMMNIQELATIKRYQLPVKILLLDNSRLGLVRQWQQLFFEQRYSETDLSDNPDFVAIANAFDIRSETISQMSQVSQALERMIDHKGAYLLHVRIKTLENVWPLVPPEKANHEMIDQV
jgi:acetolactate synthase-1/2/3 large subunit